MRQVQLASLVAVLMLGLFPGGALAQAPPQPSQPPQPWTDPEDLQRVDFSASAGGVLPTRWSDLVVLGSISSGTGVLEQVLARDLRVEPKSGFSAAVTYWRGRYGFRTQGGFSRSSLRIGAIPVDASGSAAPSGIQSVGVDTWSYDVRGAIGFLEYNPSRWIWPYGFVGLGGITYRLKSPISPPLTFVGSGPVRSDGTGTTVVVAGDGRQFVLGVNELSTETVFALNYGVGTEFRIPAGPAGVGLRVEVADQMSESPLHVTMQQVSGGGAFGRTTDVRFPLVHQFSATAGIVVRIGR